MTPAEKVWWTKVVLSVVIAFLTFVVQLYIDISGLTSFTFGVIIYLGLSDLLSSMNKIDRPRGLKIGVGAYFFTWLTAWILLYTYFKPLT